jgi:predicted DsbA family dithiol-disulfide isomerase
MQVEIVIDVACSGSYRGYTHFARAPRRFRDQGGTVQVHFAPFQLDADAASDGEPLLDAIRYHKAKFLSKRSQIRRPSYD